VPPVWKVKRELRRIGLRGLDFFLRPSEFAAQLWHDLRFTQRTTVVEGSAIADRKVAVFFVFQPNEFNKSIRITCEHLVSQGYGIILVSSAPIPAPALAEMRALCWKILIRPNYGYDFGGYRDGIRLLRESGRQLDYLMLLNDSMWFPLSDSAKLIGKLESENLPINGPVFENKANKSADRRHYQSYMLLVGSKALQSEAFSRYWRWARVSSRKRVVLLYGEKQFSVSLFNAGFGGQEPSTRQVLLDALKDQSNDFLRMTLTYAAYETSDMAKEAIQLLADFSDTDRWNARAIAHMRRAIDDLQPMGVYCYACMMLLDFSFLKKSSYPTVHDGMRWQYLRAVKAGDLPSPHPDILAEILMGKCCPLLTTDPAVWKDAKGDFSALFGVDDFQKPVSVPKNTNTSRLRTN
jgi:Rhamnan synthesis protein F